MNERKKIELIEKLYGDDDRRCKVMFQYYGLNFSSTVKMFLYAPKMYKVITNFKNFYLHGIFPPIHDQLDFSDEDRYVRTIHVMREPLNELIEEYYDDVAKKEKISAKN